MRLIDADNLIKDIEIAKSTHRYEDIGCRCFRRGMDRAIRIARQQPTVAPVKHGHWNFKGNGNADCSCCGYRSSRVYDYNIADLYCRYCGAKMDGEAE